MNICYNITMLNFSQLNLTPLQEIVAGIIVGILCFFAGHTKGKAKKKKDENL
jgi:hypothetical protein